MPKSILKTLQSKFSLDDFRGHQKKVIQSVIKGNSCIAVMATGCGKSLCYQLSGLYLPNLVIVVSPLLSLIDDQLQYLKSIHIHATKIDSTQTKFELNQIEALLLNQQIKFLFVSVERFENERFTKLLKQLSVSLLVIDEAHCISQWGHNFRPAYLKLRRIQLDYNMNATLLLTATATESVVTTMQQTFNISTDNTFLSPIVRDNLKINVRMSSPDTRFDQLLTLVQQKTPVIVYVNRQSQAKLLSDLLCQKGISSEYFHGGLEASDKLKIQDNFMTGTTHVLIATIAFGMGINKKNVRQVIHYGFPSSIEAYYQEIGRAGRDGLKSNCTLIASFHDQFIQKNFIDADLPSYEQCEKLILYLQNSYSSFLDINYYELSHEMDLQVAVLKTIFFFLEEKNIIKTMYQYHQFFEYRYILDIQAIEEFLEEDEIQVFKQIRIYETKNYYRYTTDISKLNMDGFSRERIELVLNKLHDYAFIKLFNRRSKTMYKILSFDFNLHVICDQVYKELLICHEAKDKKHQQLEKYLLSSKCYWVQLAKYFNQKRVKKCGECSNCLSNSLIIPKIKPTSLNQFKLKDVIIELLDLVDPEKISPHFLSRYLCGFSSPLIYKYQLHKTPGFGKFSQYGFNKVNTWVNRFYVHL